MRISWIWFVGAVVWWIDAAIAAHFNHLPHALLALLVALLFVIVAVVLRPNRARHR